MTDVVEKPKRKYFRVQKIVEAGKQHLARRRKNGTFKSLCGYRLTQEKAVGIEIKYAQPGICKRCEKCRTKMLRRGYCSERLVRLFESAQEEHRYLDSQKPFGETAVGKLMGLGLTAGSGT
jgi:hypothetical protein